MANDSVRRIVDEVRTLKFGDPLYVYTSEDLPRLDMLHEAVGLKDEWLVSDRRAEIEKKGSDG